MSRPFLTEYISWHYRDAITDYFRVWINIMWFFLHFFSIGYLLRNLLKPFKRIVEKGSGEPMDIGGFAGRLVLNSVMRLIGAISRGGIIAIGLLFLVVTAIFGFAGFFIWLTLPIVIPGLVLISFVSPLVIL